MSKCMTCNQVILESIKETCVFTPTPNALCAVLSSCTVRMFKKDSCLQFEKLAELAVCLRSSDCKRNSRVLLLIPYLCWHFLQLSRCLTDCCSSVTVLMCYVEYKTSPFLKKCISIISVMFQLGMLFSFKLVINLDTYLEKENI